VEVTEAFSKTWAEVMTEADLDSLELEEAWKPRARVAIEWGVISFFTELRIIQVFIVFAFSRHQIGSN
jgi:hypothetical protein